MKPCWHIGLVYVGSCLLGNGAECVYATPPAATQPQGAADVKKMLSIDWYRGPNLPQGLQDCGAGVIGDVLVFACGFCSGQTLASKPGRYPRGFLKKTWGLDLMNEGTGWTPLPEFPGAARQGMVATVVDGGLYYWGGFSYTDPHCYEDGYRLVRRESGWVWEPLPPFPWKIYGAGICALGSRIYVFGGADFDYKHFYTDTDRTGAIKALGSRLLTIDTRDLSAGWQHLTNCPGTPRFDHAFAAVLGSIYAIGGATGDTLRGGGGGYCTVVDNWKYEPASDRWTPIRSLHVSSGNFPTGSIVFKDRYILLIGGYQYPRIANPDGTFRDKYGVASRFQDKGNYNNEVFVYDTRTNLFGTADRYPLNNDLPKVVVHRDELFMLGGETGGSVIEGEEYGHHPDLFLRGKLRELQWRESEEASTVE